MNKNEQITKLINKQKILDKEFNSNLEKFNNIYLKNKYAEIFNFIINLITLGIIPISIISLKVSLLTTIKLALSLFIILKSINILIFKTRKSRKKIYNETFNHLQIINIEIASIEKELSKFKTNTNSKEISEINTENKELKYSHNYTNLHQSNEDYPDKQEERKNIKKLKKKINKTYKPT